jgi:hypothetical protein
MNSHGETLPIKFWIPPDKRKMSIPDKYVGLRYKINNLYDVLANLFFWNTIVCI